jgi:hypothetical protein
MRTSSNFKIVMMLLQFLATILSFSLFYTSPSWRFIESPRRIDNWIRGSPWFYESPRSIDTLCRILRGSLTQKKGKLENCGLNFQSFLEILSEKVWNEAQHYLNWLSKIERISLKLKNQKQFPFRPTYCKSIQAKKNPYLMRQSL